MSNPGYRSPVLMVALVSFLFCGIMAACAPSSARPAAPTATSFVLSPVATPRQATEQFPIPPTTHLYPSPDGTLLAAEYSSGIKLYTLEGQEQGTPVAGAGVWSWLPDSSGLFITQNSGPLLIMDRQGRAHSTGLDISYPELSQDGRWIGGTAPASNGAFPEPEIAPRSGGPVRVLAQNGAFLGWQNNRAIYSTGGYGSQLYALNPESGASLLLYQLTSDEGAAEPVGEIVNSPDGQILFLQLGKFQSMMLVGNQLLPTQLTPALIAPPFWVGPHDIMTVTSRATDPSGDYVIQDVATGAVIRDTGLSPSTIGTILAISGNWLVTSTSSDLQQLLPLNLVNYVTKAAYANAVGFDPNVTLESNGVQQIVFPLGNQGKFLTTFSITNSNDRKLTSMLVLIDSALMAGSDTSCWLTGCTATDAR